MPSQAISTSPKNHSGRSEMSNKPNNMDRDFNITDLAFNLTTTDFIQSYAYDPVTGMDSWDNSVSWASTITSGTLTTQNTITGKRTDSIAGASGTATAIPAFLELREASGRPQLSLSVPLLPLQHHIRASGPIWLYGMGYGAYSNFTLHMRLNATAWLDCPPSCGPGGRCGGSAGCLCECGWAADAESNGPLLRLSIALEGVDPKSLDADAAAKDAVAAAIASIVAGGGDPPAATVPKDSQVSPDGLAVKVLSVSSVSSADGGAAVVAMRVSSSAATTSAVQPTAASGGAAVEAQAAATAAMAAAAAQSAFDSLQSATLSLGLQRALRGGRSGLLAKAKVRAISGQIRTQQQTVAQRRRLRAT
ncbi:hypothetical protein GPECTOR_29g97 [Gonium pectorale]|uniref:Uncharacterized protein n=1 Tax=Gonium pectorale TaxID=33097 RepID=A0A150GEW9_GONPE|nr:hypothetical protein GPECTOR_29g97 [Gonium pectorale]|eukprot:KXZ48323.1 hypothetical protein GPECTOR_29g97 [Gonium pectorale]